MKIELNNCTRVRTNSGNLIQFYIPDYMIEYWAHFLKKEKSYKDYTVIIHNYRKRSTGERSQNSHLNGHIQQICEETGNDFDVVKMTIKRRAIKRGWPIETDLDGNAYPASETKTNTLECGAGIEEAHQLADELDITLKEYEDDSK